MLSRTRKQPAVAELCASLVARYFVSKGLGDILDLYARLDATDRAIIVNRLILPKEYQQNEAKRRGHGAEVELAKLLTQLGCTFFPVDKATNPMGSHDPNVNKVTFAMSLRDSSTTFSFDLVILDGQGNTRVGIQGLVQSSDPGQFGVNKFNETREIRRAMDAFNITVPQDRTVQLWGIVDGVGYSENKNGTINNMLRTFHTFVQISSLYKAALALHAIGLCSIKAIKFNSDYYSPVGASPCVPQ
jgi:hypothetical protein